MAKFYNTNGSTEDVLPKNGKYFSLEELKKYVGGYIERIGMPNNCAMYVNEEGRLRNLPKNELPTSILRMCGIMVDTIRGNAIMLSIKEEN